MNNGAAAVLLAAAALAGGRELIVSRGQLVEIGGSFRIPEVVAQSGARLREVGTTNRTRPADYERALGPETGAILRVHQSNFRTVGFVEEAPVDALCSPRRAGHRRRRLRGRSRTASPSCPPSRRCGTRSPPGCALVCFSGDKLLGGPQAGLLVGRREAVERCRSHPLARALRIDKLSLAALEATLRLYREAGRDAAAAIPVLAMLTAGEDELARRAQSMCSQLAGSGGGARVIRAAAKAGGGAPRCSSSWARSARSTRARSRSTRSRSGCARASRR